MLTAMTFDFAMFDIDVTPEYAVGPCLEITLHTLVEITFVFHINVTIQVLNCKAVKIAKGTLKFFASVMKCGIVNTKCILTIEALFWLAFSTLEVTILTQIV